MGRRAGCCYQAIGASREVMRIENRGGEKDFVRECSTPRFIRSPHRRREMDSRQIFGLEIANSVLLFLLIARWYWSPRLARLSLRDALTPLLLLHLTRTLGLTMLVPGVIDPALPRSFAVPAAYGDLIAAVLALSSIVALRMRLRTALAVTWIFSLEGIGDLVNAFIQGIRVDVPAFELGAGWFIYTVLVPALFVTHVMVLARLLRHAREGGGILINRAVSGTRSAESSQETVFRDLADRLKQGG
jgi:hypothetical protein